MSNSAKEKLADDVIKALTGINKQDIIKVYDKGWIAGVIEVKGLIRDLNDKKYDRNNPALREALEGIKDLKPSR